MPNARSYYAAFLNLQGRLCIVVGGGKVAERKVHKLLEAGAKVRIISPDLGPRLLQWAHCGKIEWIQRPYQLGDVIDGWLVFAVTHDRRVNHEVGREAEAAGRMVNIADDPDACTLIVPASVQRGSLHVAMSTSGSNPSRARKLRQTLESDLDQGTCYFQKEIISASSSPETCAD